MENKNRLDWLIDYPLPTMLPDIYKHINQHNAQANNMSTENEVTKDDVNTTEEGLITTITLESPNKDDELELQ